MIFGKCQVCLEKDNRIADLKEQLEFFKGMLAPKVPEHRFIPATDAQEDMLLSGSVQEELTLPQDEIESEEVLQERERMLSGSY